MAVFIRLGDLLFNGSEAPEGINGGGDQMIKVHTNIGGKRIIDALGKNDSDIRFSGLFRGIISLERVKYLDTLRINGNTVPFSYSFFNYTVIVKSFTWNMKMVYQVYYDIVLTVVQDLNQPIYFPVVDSISDILQSAYTEANDLALFLNVGGVIGAMGILGLSLEAVSDLNALTTSDIASISSAISGATSSVNNAINSL